MLLSNSQIQPIQVNNKQFSALENLDLSQGFVCDVETGICGPAEDVNAEKINLEEKKNANNHMV